jgi:2-methylcitrate dehydratase PrpD
MALDEEGFVNALGIAYHRAAGNLQCIHDGALAKRVGPGFAVRDGIMCALLAEKGITGAKSVLEGRHGLFNVYHGAKYNRDMLIEDIGQKYWVSDVSFKPYSSCRETHAAIDATLSIAKENGIMSEDVEEVIISVNRRVMDTLCTPLAVKRNPRNEVDAQFSIPWTVAGAIARGRIESEIFRENCLRDATMLKLSNKVRAEIADSERKLGLSSAEVTIRTKEGGVYSKRVDYPYGSPQNPMSREALAAKFRDCAGNAAIALNDENIEQAMKFAMELERVADVREITRLLS